ncbi:MAG: LacI family DNA-binding transcriptional regulator [Spirochaetota bacterium]
MNIRDIAKKAHVSYMTVSRVINGSPRVNAGTRTRIEKIIRSTGYVPDHAAGMVRRKTRTAVGLILPRMEYSFFDAFINRFSEACAREGYDPEIYLSRNDPEEERRCVHALASRRARGIVLAAATADLDILALAERYIDSIILLGATEKKVTHNYVGVPERGIARTAVHALASQGHTNVLLVTSQMRTHTVVGRTTERVTLLTEEASRVGLRIASTIALDNDDYDELIDTDSIRAAVQNGITAALCENDFAAMKIYRAVHDAHLAIPDDLSVIGIDDIFSSRYMTPPLTTIAIRYETTVDTIISYLRSPSGKPKQISFPAAFCERSSIKNILRVS